MRIVITGATGWIGSATAQELLGAGHEVAGLARSDRAVTALRAAGVRPVPGDLDDLDSLRRAAQDADAVVHLAFKHDFSDVAAAGRTEHAAVSALADVLAGSGRPLLLASGVAMLAPGRVATEDDMSAPSGLGSPRGGSESLAREQSARGFPVVGLRFAPSVHGAGDHGFVAELVRVARERGVSGYVGDGAGRWPAVHRSDAVRLVRLAVEHPQALPVVHAVAEEGVPTRDIAQAIGDELGLPVRSVDPADAAAHFGWIGAFFGVDAPASSARTREVMGWAPTGPTLLEDLAAGHYTR